MNGMDNDLMCSLVVAMLKGMRCLIVADIQDGSYEVYKAAEDGSGAELSQKGEDIRSFAQELVCESDREKALKFFEDRDRACYVSAADGGSIVLKALVLDDVRYAVCVNGTAVEEADVPEEEAGRDALTGVKNRAAYERDKAQLDKDIREDDAVPFAIVIAEVNGMRRSKDKLPKIAADKQIKSACRLVAATFKHSPVYRISEYEFAVLLRGYDYDIRDTLMDSLMEASEKNERMGLATISCGMSVFAHDKYADDVAKRAQRAMQVSQRHFKALK